MGFRALAWVSVTTASIKGAVAFDVDLYGIPRFEGMILGQPHDIIQESIN